MRIGICSGFVNPLTVAHSNYIKEAKKIVDYLYVIVNTDKQVEIKGSCPFMSENERLTIIAELKSVDKAILAIDKDGGVADTIEYIYLSTLEQYQEDLDLGFLSSLEYIFLKGGDRSVDNKPLPQKELDMCNKYGIKVVYGVGGFDKVTSSSELIKNAVGWYYRDKINFVLEDKELEKAIEFMEHQREDSRSEGCSGGRFSYIFTPTNIGLGVSVRDEISKEECNVTDYSMW